MTFPPAKLLPSNIDIPLMGRLLTIPTSIAPRTVWFKGDSIEWNVGKTIADYLNYHIFGPHGMSFSKIRDWVAPVFLKILNQVFLMGSSMGYTESFNTNGLYSFLILSSFSFTRFLCEEINPCGLLRNAFQDSTPFFARQFTVLCPTFLQ